jgi:hypothetical protein
MGNTFMKVLPIKKFHRLSEKLEMSMAWKKEGLGVVRALRAGLQV